MSDAGGGGPPKPPKEFSSLEEFRKVQPPGMRPQQQHAVQDYAASLGIRGNPTTNAGGFVEFPSTLRGMSSFPHGTPASERTPAHITDIRRAEEVQSFPQLRDKRDASAPAPVSEPYTIHERTHREIGPDGRLGSPRRDRFMASIPDPVQGRGYQLFPALVDRERGTVTVLHPDSSSSNNPPLSPRSQGRTGPPTVEMEEEEKKEDKRASKAKGASSSSSSS